MSRAFVKDDAPDAHIVIPPRPPLPPGVANYVTPTGLRLLRKEMADLEAERTRLQTLSTDDPERARQLTILNGRITELAVRLSSAKVIDPSTQPQDEVRFGATVTVRTKRGDERRFTIVGVDEAFTAEDNIAFTAPMARVVTGHRAGETVTLQTARGKETLTIIRIAYDAA